MMSEINTEQWLQQLPYECMPSSPALFILMGLSGSGKSSVSRYLIEQVNAAWINSDTERLKNYKERDDKYSPATTQALFDYMAILADQLLNTGYPVIIDSCALKQAERALFRQAANKNHCPVILLYCHAPEDVLKQRIKDRLLADNDISQARPELVELQKQWLEPPSNAEKSFLINIDTYQNDWQSTLKQELEQRF